MRLRGMRGPLLGLLEESLKLLLLFYHISLGRADVHPSLRGPDAQLPQDETCSDTYRIFIGNFWSLLVQPVYADNCACEEYVVYLFPVAAVELGGGFRKGTWRRRFVTIRHQLRPGGRQDRGASPVIGNVCPKRNSSPWTLHGHARASGVYVGPSAARSHARPCAQLYVEAVLVFQSFESAQRLA